MYKIAIELLFALVKMNVEGEKGTFKPTCAAKTRHSTQRNLKFSGRVKPNIASGLPVTQLRDTILHSSFLPTDPCKWPAGTYGIPKPKTGCPSSDGFQWMTGSRLQDTNNNESKNKKSVSFHLDAVVDKKKVERSFCLKTSTAKDQNRTTWPSG